MAKKGFIHIYTGHGKGKTTAALGLALRAIGAGKKVAVLQFMKGKNTAEYRAIKKYRLPIYIQTFGIGFYQILGDTKPQSAHQAAARKALEKAARLIRNDEYDIIILDEINVALSLGLVDLNEVIGILGQDIKAEIVLTGRDAPREILKLADLVTEMKEKKHYFNRGVKARPGIEY